MSRKCLSGVSMDWLMLFLLQVCNLTSAVDHPYLQNNTVVCTGQKARFRWEYEVKPFLWIVWNHNRTKIALSTSLTIKPEEILSDQFKGRLTFNSTDPFSFTLENATKGDNGMYECVFAFEGGSMDSLVGNLEVQDLVINNSLVEEVKRNDSCVTLGCKADPPCTWTFPNETTKFAKTIDYCWKKEKEMIRCESVCTYTNYTACCITKSKTRRRRSSDGILCSCEDDDPSPDTINPVPIVPIVLGVVAPITAIAVITVIIVFYKRRSREHGVRYMSTPMEDK